MESRPLSALEHLFLAAIVLLGNDAYGMAIFEKAQDIARPHGIRVRFGSVYPTLDRMERSGWLDSHISDPISERGGRRKRHYRAKPLGEQALKNSSAFHNDLGVQIETVLR